MSEFERVSEFTVGSVIGNTWTMFCKKPMAFMLCVFLSGVLSALLIGVGVFIAGLAGFSAVHANPMAIANFGAGTIVTVLVGALAAIIVSMLVAILVQGAIIYATFRIFMNGQVSMSEAFGRSI